MSFRSEFKNATVGATPGFLNRLTRLSRKTYQSGDRSESVPRRERELNLPESRAAVVPSQLDLAEYTRGYQAGRNMYLARKRGEMPAEMFHGMFHETNKHWDSYVLGHDDGVNGYAYKTSWPA